MIAKNFQAEDFLPAEDSQGIPPTSIRVMHLVFTLRFVDGDIADQAQADGWCSKKDLVISLREGMRPRLLCDAIWHEIGHACFYSAGIADEGLTEEQVCRQLTGPMLCVVKDNPGLLAWTASLLKADT